MLDHRNEGLLRGLPLTGVTDEHGHVRAERECLTDLFRAMLHDSIEGIDGDDEGQAAGLEKVDWSEAVLQTPGIDEDDAPMAPRTRSSHMNQNRFWPGEPNRYRTSSSSIEMRPKSMATVVVVLLGVAVRSSTPMLAEVMTASVRSGTISETAPTNVVLPAPKPPDTTIFVDRVGLPSEPLKATEHPPQECWVPFVPDAGRSIHDLHQPQVNHVRDDHSGYPEWHRNPGRDLRDGDSTRAELDHAGVLRRQQRTMTGVVTADRRADQRLEGETTSWLRPPAGA
jgi:hypothetical protein